MLFDCVIFEFALVKVKTFLSSLGSFSSCLFFFLVNFIYLFIHLIFIYTR